MHRFGFRKLFPLLAVLFIFSSLIFCTTTFAADGMTSVIGGLTTTGDASGFGTDPQSVQNLVVGAINIVLGLLGLTSLALTIYAGILYVISQGEKDKIEKAKSILTWSIIGMVIIVAAYAIASYLLGGISVMLS